MYRRCKQVSGSKFDPRSTRYLPERPLAINTDLVLVKVWIPMAYVPDSTTAKS